MGHPEQVDESAVLAPEQDGQADHTEDVLAEPVEQDEQPPALPPRSFRTVRDYVAVALVAVAVLVTGVVVWQHSDARATVSETTSAEAPVLAPVTALPPSLAEVWRAPSGVTKVPVAVGSVVVTGDGGEVTGRDPLTGAVRWRYSRDWPLCTISSAWEKAIVAYRKETNCSEITALDPVSGKRGAQRNGDAELGTRLLNEGSHLVTTGKTFFEVYRRDDLVRAMEYGKLRAIVNPNKQPRTGCEYGTVAVAAGKVAVIERCYGEDPADRLSVLKPNPEKSDAPEVTSTVVVGGKGARVVAVTVNRVAVALPDPARLVVYDTETGGQVAEYPLDLPAGDFAEEPADHVVPTMTSTANVYWYTGSSTIALSLNDLSPQWTQKGSIGPGTTLAGRVLVPVDAALKVLDQTTGAEVGSIPVNRQGYSGPVQLNTVGPVVLEQRGPTLVALR